MLNREIPMAAIIIQTSYCPFIAFETSGSINIARVDFIGSIGHCLSTTSKVLHVVSFHFQCLSIFFYPDLKCHRILRQIQLCCRG